MAPNTALNLLLVDAPYCCWTGASLYRAKGDGKGRHATFDLDLDILAEGPPG